MKTVRQRLLEYIYSHRAVTALELCQVFKMSSANARYHLSILSEQGLIQVIGLRPSAGKGRPGKIFGPSNITRENNLDLLAGLLLDYWREAIGETTDDESLQVLAGRLADRMAHQQGLSERTPSATENLTRRLSRTIQVLEQNHYQARWEAHAGAPRILLGHCPYLAILEKHPELCKIDALLIEHLSGASVELVSRLSQDSAGLKFCMFHVIKERV